MGDNGLAVSRYFSFTCKRRVYFAGALGDRDLARPQSKNGGGQVDEQAQVGDHEDQAGIKSGPSSPQVPRKYPQVRAILMAAAIGEVTREQLQISAGMKDREYFRKEHLHVLLDFGLLEMTIPDKPRSSRQRYRLTAKGREFLRGLKGEI